ncbi:hypothetical protein LguiB_019415 [Lonicera macranthoides]
MTDHKTWLWKKKSTEKSLVAADKVNLSVGGHEEEIQILQNDKAELERNIKNLTEKLSSALAESNAKDDIAKQQARMAQEAIAGWEKAESEAISFKEELDKAIEQRIAGEERLTNLDAALKECMQQLRFVRDEQEKRIHDALTKTSREFEKTRIFLEEKLAEASKRLTKSAGENNQLSKALLAKEKAIEDLKEHRARAEADFSNLTNRLESMEKENASLKYEVRVLEKELEIRNEEREFNRRTADVAHKQHLESVKKIAKLESECQRLRVLVRKRLPGPAALAKMKSEVEILGSETRRRRSNSSLTSSMDFSFNAPDTPSKRINYLTEQLYAMEEENRTLKETLYEKTNELQFYESSKSQTARARNLPAQQELSLASMSDLGSDEKASCAESWASALISELEQFKNGKQTEVPLSKTVGASDINLMDDFVEMEKLAIVCVTNQEESNAIAGPFDSQAGEFSSEVTVNGRLDDIVKMVSEQIRVTRRNPNEVLEDIKVALAHVSHLNPSESIDTKESSNQRFNSELSKSIHKVIELIDGINLPSPHYGKDDSFLPYKNSEAPTDYMVRVFQWKTSDLGAVLQRFVQTCYDLLNGKAGVQKFTEEITYALDWIMNHCFSIQDVSSMKDEIKKHFDWDESRSECEVEAGMINHISEAYNFHVPKEESRRLKDELANIEYAKKDLEGRLQSETGKSESLMIQLRELEKRIGSLQKEIETLKQSNRIIQDQIENHKVLKEDLNTQLTMAKVELSEARQKNFSLEEDLENKNNCCEELEAACLELQLQLESMTKKEVANYEMEQEEKQRQNDWEITAASEKLAECQETILNLGKQLKALASPKDTTLLKVNSTPTDSVTTTTTPKKNLSHRTSLLDKMLAEDDAETGGDLRSPMTKEVICTSNSPKQMGSNSFNEFGLNGAVDSPEKFLGFNGVKQQDEGVVNSLAIVPSKKKGGHGLWKKLFSRRNKGICKKTLFP